VRVCARISDNVLDPEDWNIYELVFARGRVVEVVVVNPGVYGGSVDDFIGMTIEQLSDWSRLDATGQHPETYYELAPSPSGPWEGFVSHTTIKEWLGR